MINVQKEQEAIGMLAFNYISKAGTRGITWDDIRAKLSRDIQVTIGAGEFREMDIMLDRNLREFKENHQVVEKRHLMRTCYARTFFTGCYNNAE